MGDAGYLPPRPTARPLGGSAIEKLFAGTRTVRARAWFLGERIDVRALEKGDVLGVAPLIVRAGARGCAALLREGVVVLFELDPVEEAAFRRDLAPFVQDPFADPESEDAEIAVDPDGDERVDVEGVLHLREASVERLQVVADVLAKSAVLSHYEERVAEVFDEVEPLAERLGRGRTGRSRVLLRRIGDVLRTQTRTVGRFEVTEKPDSTWERPDLDRLHGRLSSEYELRERDRALGRKLEVISRTAETLLEVLHNRRALRVEWYIVVLIAVEIVLIVYEMYRPA